MPIVFTIAARVYVRRTTKTRARAWNVPVTARIIAVLLSLARSGSTADVLDVEDIAADGAAAWRQTDAQMMEGESKKATKVQESGHIEQRGDLRILLSILPFPSSTADWGLIIRSVGEKGITLDR